MAHREKIRAALHAFAGILALSWFLIWRQFAESASAFGYVSVVALGAGLLILGGWAVLVGKGYLLREGVLAHLFDIFCIAFASLSLTIFALDGVFRAVGFDFARQEQATLAYPPFYREPTVPLGEVYYRRFGPEVWTGQPIRTLIRLHGMQYNPYENETTISVKYNELGFRQEEGYLDWDLAIAGDSFTELGILDYSELPTTLVGKLLNLRVVNLGVVVTGPLTHLSYLRAFGMAPSTRRLMIIFFEGNDLADLDSEFAALSRFQETGRRNYREFKTQTSLIKALMDMRRVPQRKKPADRLTAVFKDSRGDIPISLDYTPPAAKNLSPSTIRQLDYFFTQYAEFARDRRVEAWLVYMPCKIRVIRNQIEFFDSAPKSQTTWTPTDLPKTIGSFSRRHGIRFIDLTPALVTASKNRRTLLFNPFYDTHLNSEGARVVGEEIARHLEMRAP